MQKLSKGSKGPQDIIQGDNMQFQDKTEESMYLHQGLVSQKANCTTIRERRVVLGSTY